MVNWFTASDILLFVLSACLLIYLMVRIWPRRSDGATGIAGIDFRPSIGFTRLDGCRSLAILLLNKSKENVWAEEVELVLTELMADDQSSEASCREVLKIKQTVQPLDTLPVSLVETIYKAAGGLQRRYSCTMSAMVRFRAGTEWFEKPMQPYRLKMAGLTLVSSRLEPWAKSEFAIKDKSQDLEIVGTNSK